MHQDAHEFLNYLLNQIVEEMDEMRKRGLDAQASESGRENGNAKADGVEPSVNGGEDREFPSHLR